MLSHECRCIFVHVPKTAGKSIERFFLERLGLDHGQRDRLLLRMNSDPDRGPHVLDHLKATEYLTGGYVTERQFADYFKFAFVRNPWDRVVSEYRYRGYPGRFDFKTYLFEHWPEPGWNDLYLHVIPQYEFVFDEEGTCRVDFIGKFENLEADFHVVRRRLDLGDEPLPHQNRSLGKERAARRVLRWLRNPLRAWRQRRDMYGHYEEYYDAESRDFVARRFRKDVEAFGYEFGD